MEFSNKIAAENLPRIPPAKIVLLCLVRISFEKGSRQR